MAPIVPHLAEDVWQNLPFLYTVDGSVAQFVFESRWPATKESWLAFPHEEVDFWGKLLELRTEVNKVLEAARIKKMIGSSLEAKVYIHAPDASLADKLLKMCAASHEADALNRIFIVSQVEILPTLENVTSKNVPHSGEYTITIQENTKIWVAVARADGSKCERCWNYSTQVGDFPEHPTLCPRCYNVVGVQPIPELSAVS